MAETEERASKGVDMDALELQFSFLTQRTHFD